MTEEQANFITTRIFPHIIVSPNGCWEWQRVTVKYQRTTKYIYFTV